MPLEKQFRDKYAGRSPERIYCPNSVRLVTPIVPLTISRSMIASPKMTGLIRRLPQPVPIAIFFSTLFFSNNLPSPRKNYDSSSSPSSSNRFLLRAMDTRNTITSFITSLYPSFFSFASLFFTISLFFLREKFFSLLMITKSISSSVFRCDYASL